VSGSGDRAPNSTYRPCGVHCEHRIRICVRRPNFFIFGNRSFCSGEAKIHRSRGLARPPVRGVPGWEKLHNRGRLGRAAEACAAHAGCDEPDYTVDLLGWQAIPQPMDGPAMPGLAGGIQAQYNLLLHLNEFPDASSLRAIQDGGFPEGGSSLKCSQSRDSH
jgi:hypothetical protein